MSSPRVLVEMQNVIALYEMEKNNCDHIVVVLNFPRCRCKDLSWYVSMPITTLRGLSNILREVGFCYYHPEAVGTPKWNVSLCHNGNMLPFPFCTPWHECDYKPYRDHLTNYPMTASILNPSPHSFFFYGHWFTPELETCGPWKKRNEGNGLR